jgi:hypothetical protein
MTTIGAEVYVGGARFGGTYLEGSYLDDCRLAERVHRSSLSTEPAVDHRTCHHEDRVVGEAYVDVCDWRWPVEVCRSCRLILKGRAPQIRERSRPKWKMDADDLLAARWNRTWPKSGRPRAKNPPKVVWPEAA